MRAAWTLAPLLALACAPGAGLPPEAPSPRDVTLGDPGPPGATPPPERTLRLDADGALLTLELDRLDDLFADDYAERRIGHGGPLDHPRTAWADAHPCFYAGPVLDASGTPVGRAALRTCDGPVPHRLTGAVVLHGTPFALAPTGPGTAPPHRLVPARTHVHDRLLPQGLPGTGLDPAQLPPPPSGAAFLDLWAVNDALYTADAGGSPEADTATVLALVHDLYRNADLGPETVVILGGQTTFVGSDPFTPVSVGGGEVDSEDLLTQFNTWADANLPAHDHHQLLSGHDFDSVTLGLAGLSTLCTGAFSGSIVEALWPAAGVAAVSAHELGHSLGMVHDGVDNACDPSAFLMAASGDPLGPQPTAFSTCSEAEAIAYLAGVDCTTDAPGDAWDSPSCGNGVVDPGEDCDCGPGGCDDLDPCCDADTCTLSAGATCSALDGCCSPDTCTPYDAASATVCRPARSDCDLPEVCDGGVTCPPDEVEPAGGACDDARGFAGACFAGDCVTYPGQCADADAVFGQDVSYDTSCAPFIASDPCGDLVCEVDGTGCFTLTIQGQPPLSVADGTPCGVDRQCLAGTCVDSALLEAATDLCPDDDDKVRPGVCGCGEPDDDTDGDGTPDCEDACPDDPDKVLVGSCGCGEPDDDTDGDGTPDCDDPCPDDPDKVQAGLCGCGEPDDDTDGDGTPDCDDPCPDDATDQCVIGPDNPEGPGAGCACDGRGPGGVPGWLALVGVLAVGRRARRPGR